MNEKSTTAFEPIKPFLAALARTNQFMVGQSEKWVALHMNSLKSYIDLGVAQVKVAAKVVDPHNLHEFSDSQFAVASFVGHRILDDGRAAVEWGADCYAQANRLARQNALGFLFKY